ncbi:MAG: MFS transporter [Gemmatimonadetes bacterium]|nr:MFS transporter [Gemmatimonadota bacterium]MBT6145579.1 MFS transporter [Gemmatimonadota bacterium]MBT7863498.1 MFS transporter [Gemmatimonadota bacterium]
MTSFLPRLYAHCFVDELMLIYPFYAVMFVDHGLSPIEISTLLAVWCAVTLILEVPSGVLADRHSRKALMVFGTVLRAAGYACWALFPGFWGFLAGFVLWGTEGALGSGAFEALVYDELKHAGRESEYARVVGRCRSLGQMGVVVSGAIAAGAIALGYGVLLFASSAAAIVAGLLMLSLPTVAPVAPIGATGFKAYTATLRAGIGEVVLRPFVRRLVLFAALAMSLGGTLEEYWPILLAEMDMPAYALGLFLSILWSAQAVASLVAHRFVDLSDRTIYATFTFSGVLLFGAAWSLHVAALGLILIFVFVLQAIDIIYDARLQAAIPSEHRATASSVKSFGSEVGGLIVVMAMGAIVTGRSYQVGFEWFGITITLLGAIYLLLTLRAPGGAAGSG